MRWCLSPIRLLVRLSWSNKWIYICGNYKTICFNTIWKATQTTTTKCEMQQLQLHGDVPRYLSIACMWFVNAHLWQALTNIDEYLAHAFSTPLVTPEVFAASDARFPTTPFRNLTPHSDAHCRPHTAVFVCNMLSNQLPWIPAFGSQYLLPPCKSGKASA